LICDCKCHQDIDEKSNCGNCNNTGIKIENISTERNNPTKMESIKNKPYFSKI